MILYAEHWVVTHPKPLERLVIEVDVRDFNVTQVERIGIDGETVIVRRDLHLARQFVDDGMICAAMAEFHLVGFTANRQAENLITQADSEDRNLADEIPHV